MLTDVRIAKRTSAVAAAILAFLSGCESMPPREEYIDPSTATQPQLERLVDAAQTTVTNIDEYAQKTRDAQDARLKILERTTAVLGIIGAGVGGGLRGLSTDKSTQRTGSWVAIVAGVGAGIFAIVKSTIDKHEAVNRIPAPIRREILKTDPHVNFWQLLLYDPHQISDRAKAVQDAAETRLRALKRQ